VSRGAGRGLLWVPFAPKKFQKICPLVLLEHPLWSRAMRGHGPAALYNQEGCRLTVQAVRAGLEWRRQEEALVTAVKAVVDLEEQPVVAILTSVCSAIGALSLTFAMCRQSD
jgi:hypothetical protein